MSKVHKKVCKLRVNSSVAVLSNLKGDSAPLSQFSFSPFPELVGTSFCPWFFISLCYLFVYLPIIYPITYYILFSCFLIISIYLSYLLSIHYLLSSHYFNFLWIFSLIGFLPIPFFCKKLAKKKCIFQNSLLFSFVFL